MGKEILDDLEVLSTATSSLITSYANKDDQEFIICYYWWIAALYIIFA